jgi:endonuclease YncB( thermonuclease family)
MNDAKPKIILSIAGIIILVVFILAMVILLPKLHFSVPHAVIESATVQPGYYKISHVTDGDTFDINMDGHTEAVRMIGVDTPETVKPNSPPECYGKEASDFSKKTLGGQTVRLEADPTNQNRDRYNRLLRYVYLPDGSLYEATLISRGYGFAYLSFPFTKSKEFAALQDTAQKQAVGLWAGQCQISNQNGRYKTNQL